MFPGSSMFDIINNSFTNIVFFLNNLSRECFTIFSNSKNLINSKFCMRASVLTNHISYIICLCSYKQMVRINTNRVITVMTNNIIFGKRIWFKIFGRKSMGLDIPSLKIKSAPPTMRFNNTIPLPASIFSYNVFGVKPINSLKNIFRMFHRTNYTKNNKTYQNKGVQL